MTLKIEERQVPRRVNVATCNKCGVEAFDSGLIGWMVCCLYENRTDLYTGTVGVGSDPKKDNHVCPVCSRVLTAAMNAGTTLAVSVDEAEKLAAARAQARREALWEAAQVVRTSHQKYGYHFPYTDLQKTAADVEGLAELVQTANGKPGIPAPPKPAAKFVVAMSASGKSMTAEVPPGKTAGEVAMVAVLASLEAHLLAEGGLLTIKDYELVDAGGGWLNVLPLSDGAAEALERWQKAGGVRA